MSLKSRLEQAEKRARLQSQAEQDWRYQEWLTTLTDAELIESYAFLDCWIKEGYEVAFARLQPAGKTWWLELMTRHGGKSG